MGGYENTIKKQFFLFLVIIGIWMLWVPRVFQSAGSPGETPHKVHIAFGFHVNLYHSFRGDTNDENGFGQDIRVIRHIIKELDSFNRRGIPVSGIWDFDNLFSLQEILPVHAPDIISDIQRRVRENRDEVILMSYNNGMMSAMNHEEFMVSMNRAFTNQKGSGVQDLFGQTPRVVRPQEMMTTPGNFDLYQELGIPFVALYYSATSFDAFRAFSRQLTPTEAYNPVRYQNPSDGEQIIIMPTYHPGDLVEHISLRQWALKLHRLQSEGTIDRDVMLFINFDADAEFWTGDDFPKHLRWLPNTGGLGQLINSVADLDFVTFTKVTKYLEKHPPAGTIHFSQDTADGNFNGYNSWAEKSYASDYWRRVVRNRDAHWMVEKLFAINGGNVIPSEIKNLLEKSFEIRMRALSTTNFGLSAPFLARQREEAMASLLEQLDECSRLLEAEVLSQAESMIRKVSPPTMVSNSGYLVDTFLHLEQGNINNPSGDRILEFTIPARGPAGKRYFLADTKGHILSTSIEKKKRSFKGSYVSVTLRIDKHQAMPDGIYFLFADDSFTPSDPYQRVFAGTRLLKNEFISVHFDQNGHVSQVTGDGVIKLEAGSMVPYIIHDGIRYAPERMEIIAEETGEKEFASVRIRGEWEGPPGITRAPGWVDYRLRLVSGIPYLFIDGEVQYPDTDCRDVIHSEKPMLARKIDAGWETVAPLELQFAGRAYREEPFYIHKRNFLGKEDTYAVDYYRYSSENLDVASINNHITPEYTAVTTGGQGMAVAMNTKVNANFAFCPFQMTHFPETDEFSIRANPFGTYHGKQILPPTSGNRLGYKAVLLSAPHLHSAGPTYNGYSDRFELMVTFFEGDEVPENVKKDLISFAHRPATIGICSMENARKEFQSFLPPNGFLALPYRNGILFHWEKAGPPGTKYRILFKENPGSPENSITSDGQTIFVKTTDFLTSGSRFAAAIQAIYPNGRLSLLSPEIEVDLAQKTDPSLEIPRDFLAKILWTNASAWIRHNLL
jgi:hypothetical protein